MTVVRCQCVIRQSIARTRSQRAQGPRRSGVLHVAEGLRDAQARGHLVGAAGGDPPKMNAVLAGSPSALADVQGDRGRGPAHLLREIRVSPVEDGERLLERPDEFERDVEGLERHVRLLFGWGLPHPAQAP